MKYKNYLFDLDGTLTDPGLGIKNSIKYALAKLGKEIPDDKTLNEFIGPPLLVSFRKYCGATEDEAKTLLVLYREYFGVRGYLENELYPDTDYILSEIKKQGGKVYLATSKPQEYAVKILEHFDILKYFDFCAGNDLDESRPTKAAVLEYLMSECSLSPDDSLMIGDRCYDIEGARAKGLPVAAVLHGYGSREELANADYIIESFKDLLDI